jgi:CII-binding regulator of phage lambda lysogenization HflD
MKISEKYKNQGTLSTTETKMFLDIVLLEKKLNKKADHEMFLWLQVECLKKIVGILENEKYKLKIQVLALEKALLQYGEKGKELKNKISKTIDNLENVISKSKWESTAVDMPDPDRSCM